MSNTAMGFDFGTKRIGIATGQDLTGTAQGVATVGNSGKNGPWNDIEELIHQWQPDMLVVGLPLGKEGAETMLSTAARQFGTELASRFSRPVHYTDETLTSRVAESVVAGATPAGKRMIGRQKNLRDQIAAELILSTFFNEQSQKSNVV